MITRELNGAEREAFLNWVSGTMRLIQRLTMCLNSSVSISMERVGFGNTIAEAKDYL